MNGLPEGVADQIITNVTVRLDWRERVLLLFRPLCVTVTTDCEVAPGKVSSESRAWAARWRWPWEHRGGYAKRCGPPMTEHPSKSAGLDLAFELVLIAVSEDRTLTDEGRDVLEAAAAGLRAARTREQRVRELRDEIGAMREMANLSPRLLWERLGSILDEEPANG